MSGSEVLLDMEDILKDVYQRVLASDIADRLETHLSRLMRYMRQHPERKEDLVDLRERLKTLIQRYHQEALHERVQQGPQITMRRRGRPMKEIIDPPSSDGGRLHRSRSRIEDRNLCTTSQSAPPEFEARPSPPQDEKIRRGDPINPDRRYGIHDAALLICKRPNTLYDYNSRKDVGGNRKPVIPYGKDDNGGVWYLGKDLIQFLNRNHSGLATKKAGELGVRRKHEGKGQREFDPKRSLEKARLSELKKIKGETILRRNRR